MTNGTLAGIREHVGCRAAGLAFPRIHVHIIPASRSTAAKLGEHRLAFAIASILPNVLQRLPIVLPIGALAFDQQAGFIRGFACSGLIHKREGFGNDGANREFNGGIHAAFLILQEAGLLAFRNKHHPVFDGIITEQFAVQDIRHTLPVGSAGRVLIIGKQVVLCQIGAVHLCGSLIHHTRFQGHFTQGLDRFCGGFGRKLPAGHKGLELKIGQARQVGAKTGHAIVFAYIELAGQQRNTGGNRLNVFKRQIGSGVAGIQIDHCVQATGAMEIRKGQAV